MKTFRYLMVVMSLLLASQAFGAAQIGAAFGCYSNATGKVCAGQSGTNTAQLIGATIGKVGGKPTVTITPDSVGADIAGAAAVVDASTVHLSGKETITGAKTFTTDVIIKGPQVDVRSFMDGQSGRASLSTWQANNLTTDVTTAVQAMFTYLQGTGGGVAFFPTGTYLFSSSVAVPSSTRIEGVAADYPVSNTTELYGGTQFVIANGTFPGVPIIDVSGTKYVTIENITFRVRGSTLDTSLALGNTAMAIADASASASFLKISRCRFAYFGGPTIKIQGNVNEISHNRMSFVNSHVIWLSNGSSDNTVIFNDLGAHISNLTGTDDAGIYIESGTANTIVGNLVYNMGYGILLGGSYPSYNRIEANRCEKHSYSGILIGGNGRGNLVVGNESFNNGYVSGAQGIVLNGNATNNSIVGNYVFSDTSYPGGTNQLIGIQISTGCNFNLVEGNYAYNLQQTGIFLSGASFNAIKNNYVYKTQMQGITVQTASNDNAVSGNFVYMAGQAADATYDAILVNDNSNRTTISNNTVRSGGGASQPRYGIRVNSADCNTTSIWTNDVTTASRNAGISDVGTSTEIRANRGFATDNKGTANISSGNTSITVSHSLAVTPAIGNIRVVPTNNLGTATKFWVSNVTSSQFTINVDQNPGAASATFAWSVEQIR